MAIIVEKQLWKPVCFTYYKQYSTRDHFPWNLGSAILNKSFMQWRTFAYSEREVFWHLEHKDDHLSQNEVLNI